MTKQELTALRKELYTVGTEIIRQLALTNDELNTLTTLKAQAQKGGQQGQAARKSIIDSPTISMLLTLEDSKFQTLKSYTYSNLTQKYKDLVKKIIIQTSRKHLSKEYSLDDHIKLLALLIASPKVQSNIVSSSQ